MTASFLFLVLTLNLERQDVPASASAAGRRGYAQGSMLMTFAPAGTPYHRISPALGGHAVGLAANAGVFVTPALAVEGELVSGGTVSAPQNFSYFSREDYSVDNRDVLLNANVRWRPARTNHLEFVAGGGLASRRLASGTSSRLLLDLVQEGPRRQLAPTGRKRQGPSIWVEASTLRFP
jgi:hypothetical protein